MRRKNSAKGQHGGPRDGAGRKPRSGRFRETTVPIRVPETLLPKIRKLINGHVGKAAPILPARTPTLLRSVGGDQQSPAEKLDIYRHLIKHPGQTYCFTVSEPIGRLNLETDDLLIVDPVAKPSDKNFIVVGTEHGMVVRQFRKLGRSWFDEGGDSRQTEITSTTSVLGVVTFVIRRGGWRS